MVSVKRTSLSKSSVFLPIILAIQHARKKLQLPAYHPGRAFTTAVGALALRRRDDAAVIAAAVLQFGGYALQGLN